MDQLFGYFEIFLQLDHPNLLFGGPQMPIHTIGSWMSHRSTACYPSHSVGPSAAVGDPSFRACTWLRRQRFFQRVGWGTDGRGGYRDESEEEGEKERLGC